MFWGTIKMRHLERFTYLFVCFWLIHSLQEAWNLDHYSFPTFLLFFWFLPYCCVASQVLLWTACGQPLSTQLPEHHLLGSRNPDFPCASQVSIAYLPSLCHHAQLILSQHQLPCQPSNCPRCPLQLAVLTKLSFRQPHGSSLCVFQTFAVPWSLQCFSLEAP